MSLLAWVGGGAVQRHPKLSTCVVSKSVSKISPAEWSGGVDSEPSRTALAVSRAYVTHCSPLLLSGLSSAPPARHPRSSRAYPVLGGAQRCGAQASACDQSSREPDDLPPHHDQLPHLCGRCSPGLASPTSWSTCAPP